MDIRNNFGVHKIFVDAANPEIIRSLKGVLGESLDYNEHLTKIKQKKLGHPIFHMDVLPISFNAEHWEMLAHTKTLLDAKRD